MKGRNVDEFLPGSPKQFIDVKPGESFDRVRGSVFEAREPMMEDTVGRTELEMTSAPSTETEKPTTETPTTTPMVTEMTETTQTTAPTTPTAAPQNVTLPAEPVTTGEQPVEAPVTGEQPSVTAEDEVPIPEEMEVGDIDATLLQDTTASATGYVTVAPATTPGQTNDSTPASDSTNVTDSNGFPDETGGNQTQDSLADVIF